jgi:hypothetical protein
MDFYLVASYRSLTLDQISLWAYTSMFCHQCSFAFSSKRRLILKMSFL